MKKLLALLVAVLTMASMFVGCTPVEVKPEDFGYGASLDGVAITGSWGYAKDKLSLTDASIAENVIFRSETKENYTLSFNLKVTEVSAEQKSTFGGYAFYQDAVNNVEFTFDPEEKTVDFASVKGYDTQEIPAFYPENVDFANGASVKVVKDSNLFELYIDGVLVSSIMESYEGEGQVGFKGSYAKVDFVNVAVSDNAAFESANLMQKYTPAAGMPGTWEIEGSRVSRSDSDPTTACFEGVVFNAPVAMNYSFKATAKQTALIEGGYGFFGIVAYYRNGANYATVFFKDIYVDVCIVVNGIMQWTQGVVIPNLPEGYGVDNWSAHDVECIKIGDTLRVFVNGAFLRDIQVASFNAPGSVGFDTNGASAEFEMAELKTANSIEHEDYKADLMSAINYPHLLAYENGVYTTINPDTPGGVNYGGEVYTHGRVFGDSYTYSVDVDTTYLSGNDANLIGIYGGMSASSKIALYIAPSGYMDIMGQFTYVNEAGETVEVNGWAGLGKALPEAAFTDGVMNKEINITVAFDGTTFTFYVAGEKAYEIEAKTFNIAWPGITTNYVGASFKIN